MMTKKEKKRVPELRFAGFEGKWEEKRLDYLSEYIKSGRSKGDDNGRYNLYGSTGIIGKTNDNIDDGSYILVARVGANAGQINSVKGKFGVTDNTLIVSLKEGVSLQFINYFLIRYNLNRLIYGSGQPLVTGTLLKNIKIYIPKSSEQQKIALFLTSIDTRIQQLEKKRTLLEQYKKGVMQQIFKQEIRFKDEDGKEFSEWEERRLGELGEIITGKTPSTSNLDLWNGKVQFVTPTDIDGNKYQYKTQRTVVENSKMKVLPPKSILFTCIASIGKMSLSIKPCITNQQINSIIPFNEFDNEFIYYSLLNIVDYIKSTQSTNTLPIINKTEFSKFKINIPKDIKEQTKIAQFLTSLDAKIAVVDEQIAGTKEWKKGLLQRMFV